MPRKTYTIDGVDYLCKVPDVSEIWAVRGMLPLLPNIKNGDGISISNDNPNAMLESLEATNAVLIRCGIAPRFIKESPPIIPPGCLPINEVPPHVRLRLFTELMNDGGFTREAAEEIRPTTATTEQP